jgi:hypothetical protein
VDEPDIPYVHSGACDSKYRLRGNHHLTGLVESIVENLGEPSVDVNESGSRVLETAPENLGGGWRQSAWS